jgi:PHD/YefM family antitoxin component YafN of YafNO toxin-antitoxin module
MKTSVLEIITPQYIIDSTGKKTSVVLDLKTFNLIMEDLEDLYDIREAEKILARGQEERGRTLEEIEESLRKKD